MEVGRRNSLFEVLSKLLWPLLGERCPVETLDGKLPTSLTREMELNAGRTPSLLDAFSADFFL